MSPQLKQAQEPFTAYIQVAPFRDWEDGMFPFTYWLNQAYDATDAATSLVELEIPPKSIVLRVLHQISAVFTGVTAMTVGEGAVGAATNNDWIADAWGANTAGLLTIGIAEPYPVLQCRYYPNGGVIRIYFTGPATAGSGKLFAQVLSYMEDLTDET